MIESDAGFDAGPPNESIGRPGEWGEGRYEKSTQSPPQSVLRKPGEDIALDRTRSTPVTQEDYQPSKPRST